MITVFTKLSLSEMLVETEAIAADAQRAFGHLNAQQLNWKPGAAGWSVAQCLEHLMAANPPMLQAIDEAMAGTKRPRFFERLPVLPGLFGKLMVKIVSPGFNQKLKAPPTARPAASAIDAQVVNRFLTHQHEIAERINGLERLGAARIVMTSPFVSFITYSLLDACRLIVAHERRHLAQAQRVMETPGFPQ
ncbi:MAG: DinB family protein [Blastocatellia bacterium]